MSYISFVIFELDVFYKAKSTSVFSGWPREERSTELQITYNHPETLQLLIFLEEVRKRISSRKPAIQSL